MAKLLLILASLAFCNAEMGRQRRWRMERRKKAAAAAAARREREKNAPRDAESTSDGAIANWRQRARAYATSHRPLPAGTPIAAQNRRSDGVRRPCARRYDYIGRKDPVTGEITCPWRKGRGKVQSGGSSGVQMAG